MIEELVGKIFTSITNNDNEILFTCGNGDQYKMYHDQNCCEDVYIDDVCGDLEDLIGSQILKASEDSNHDMPSVTANRILGHSTIYQQ